MRRLQWYKRGAAYCLIGFFVKRIHKISRLGACSFKHAPYLLLQYKLYSGIFCRGISWLLIGNSVLANEEQLTSRTLASWLFYCNSQSKCL